ETIGELRAHLPIELKAENDARQQRRQGHRQGHEKQQLCPERSEPPPPGPALNLVTRQDGSPALRGLGVRLREEPCGLRTTSSADRRAAPVPARAADRPCIWRSRQPARAGEFRYRGPAHA